MCYLCSSWNLWTSHTECKACQKEFPIVALDFDCNILIARPIAFSDYVQFKNKLIEDIAMFDAHYQTKLPVGMTY